MRLKPFFWLLGGIIFTCLFFFLSLRVADTHRQAMLLDKKIAQISKENDQLQIEIAARATLPQIEKWNREILAMNAPDAQQYAANGENLKHVSIAKQGKGGQNQPRTLPAASPVAQVSQQTQLKAKRAPLYRVVYMSANPAGRHATKTQ
jgi:cell division protein FtsL